MSLHHDYTAVRISQNKLTDFISIYEDAFKSKLSLSFIKNKFNTTSLSGLNYLGFIAYSLENEPAAYYGVYPLYASIGGKPVLISQGGDTMTKRDHIGKGLFINLANYTYELCKENNVNGVFGFPLKSAYPTLKKKLNWTFIEHIKRYKFLIFTIPFSIVAEKISFLKFFYLFWVRFILLFYKNGNYFEGSVVSNCQDGILRNKSLWEYKTHSNQIFTIKVAKTNVIIKFNGKLSIGDIDVNTNTNMEFMIKKLKILAFLTFNSHLVFYVSPDTILDQNLKLISSPTNALPIGYLNFNDQFDLSKLKFTYFDFDTF
jgi:hypothetical protein